MAHTRQIRCLEQTFPDFAAKAEATDDLTITHPDKDRLLQMATPALFQLYTHSNNEKKLKAMKVCKIHENVAATTALVNAAYNLCGYGTIVALQKHSKRSGRAYFARNHFSQQAIQICPRYHADSSIDLQSDDSDNLHMV